MPIIVKDGTELPYTVDVSVKCLQTLWKTLKHYVLNTKYMCALLPAVICIGRAQEKYIGMFIKINTQSCSWQNYLK